MALPPVYYGTIDATPLWACTLHDAWRAGVPEAEIEALLPTLEGALRWVVEDGDADGDGFLEYLDHSGHGLANQGWKDSADSVRFADGTIADGPVALCEVQAYAYEAAVHGADLLDAFGRPGAERFREWAADLRERFRATYWCGEGADRFPALALDGNKRPVDTLTSNIGHLLGTGLLDPDEELTVARQLAAPDLDSGLGLRTMSAADGGYAPLSYHCGSVWPHDTAIVISGMHRAGLGEHAAGLVEGLLRASVAFDQRLPELWSGEGQPVPYPTACRPQAWSAAAAVAVATVLGASAR
jgi:glycogen debranching enzyme